MFPDPAQVVGQIAPDLAYEIVLPFVDRSPALGQFFLQFLQQFFRRLRKVLYEVQRILDFVGNARREFAQGRQFFPHDDLVLRLLKFAQRFFQRLVLATQFLCEFLHEVQPLRLDRMQSEHLKGGRHVRYFVAAVQFHLLFQVASRHAAHMFRQERQTPQQYFSDKQPGDQQGADQTDRVQRQEKLPPYLDGLSRCDRRGLCAGLRGIHETFDFSDKLDGDIAVVFDQRALLGEKLQVLRANLKDHPLSAAQFEQLGEHGLESLPQGYRTQADKAPFDAPAGRLEPLEQGLQSVGVDEVEDVRQDPCADGRLGLQFGEMTVTLQFQLGQILGSRRRRFIDVPVTRGRVEQLVVQCRYQNACQFELQLFQFPPQRLALLFKHEAPRHGLFDHADVGHQRIPARTDTLKTFVFHVVAGDRLQLLREVLPFVGNARCNGFKGFGRLRRRQTRGGRRQCSALLRHAEGRGNFRNGHLVDLALGFTDFVEGEPRDHTGHHGERYRRTDAEIQLPRNPGRTLVVQPEQPLFNHGITSRRVLMGW